MLLEKLPDFRPRVELRDVYKFMETAMDLPDKEDELERIRSRKAFESNILEGIKVEYSLGKDDDVGDEIAELAENAERHFTICGESNTDGDGDVLGKSGCHMGDDKGEKKRV